MYHPDKNNNAGANNYFLLIQEAYTTLSTPILKKKYDKERWLNGMQQEIKWSLTVINSQLKEWHQISINKEHHQLNIDLLADFIYYIIQEPQRIILLTHESHFKCNQFYLNILKIVRLLTLRDKLRILGKLQRIEMPIYFKKYIEINLQRMIKLKIYKKWQPFIIVLFIIIMLYLMIKYGQTNSLI